MVRLRAGEWAAARPSGTASRMEVGAAVAENRRMATSVLIVDDHPSFRASARRMFEADGYEVLGEAEDGQPVWQPLSGCAPISCS